MKSFMRWVTVIAILSVLAASLAACGPKGPETDLDINARVLEIRPAENWIKLNEQNSGRKYEMKTTASSEIVSGKNTITLADVQVGNQIRVWANDVGGTPRYEIIKLMVVDSGEAAPSMRQ